MEYRGLYQDAAHAFVRSGDQCADAIIQEDQLWLDVIYLLAIPWESLTDRQELQGLPEHSWGREPGKCDH